MKSSYMTEVGQLSMVASLMALARGLRVNAQGDRAVPDMDIPRENRPEDKSINLNNPDKTTDKACRRCTFALLG